MSHLVRNNINLEVLIQRKSTYIQRYYQDRRQITFGHQSLDPLEMVVKILIEKKEGIKEFSTRYNCPSCISEYMNRNTAYTRMQFKIPLKDGDILIKTVAAKSGAASKRKEMSSRMRLVRLTYDRDKKEFKKRNIFGSILIIDGEWRDEYVDLLHESGWDYICTFQSFHNVIEDIEKKCNYF